MPVKSSYTAGKFQFVLDGDKDASYVKSVDGGYYKGEVVSEQIGPDLHTYKHVSTVTVEPISLELGLSVSQPIIDWISESWNRRYSRKSGTILHADFNQRVQAEQWFYDALITETQFPTLDAASKDPAYLTVKIQPERLEMKKGSGELQAGLGAKQMLWTASNFQLDVDGCDLKYVKKIESFTVKQKTKSMHIGRDRHATIEPTGVEFPDISIEMPLAHADDLFKWYEEYVVKGRKDTKSERNGELIFYDQQQSMPLMTVKLERMGLFSLQINKSEAMSEQIKTVKAQFYVEGLDLQSGFGLE